MHVKLSTMRRARRGVLVLVALAAIAGTIPASAAAASQTIFKGSYKGNSVEAFYSDVVSSCRSKDVHVTAFRPAANQGLTYLSVDTTVWDGCSGNIVSQRYGFAAEGVTLTNDRLRSASLKAKVGLYDAGVGVPVEPSPLAPAASAMLAADLAAAASASGGTAPPAPPVSPVETLTIDIRLKAMPGFHTSKRTDTYRNRAAGIRMINRSELESRDAMVEGRSFSWGTISRNKDSYVQIIRDTGTVPGTVPVPPAG